MPISLSRSLLVMGMAMIAGAAFADPQGAPPPPASPQTPLQAPVRMPAKMTASEFHLGDPKAKVTLVEYASDTCPHCARFANEVFPAFKAKYVETGKVQYIFREFPTDPVELSAAGFVVARCAGESKYFDVVNALFQAQHSSTTGKDFLLAGAKAGDLNEEQVKTCLNDTSAVADLNTRVQHAIDVEKIDGTPTFILNGKKLESGEKTLKDLDAAIEPLLPPTTAKPLRKRRKG